MAFDRYDSWGSGTRSIYMEPMVVYYINMENKTTNMTYQPTANDFDKVINGFYREMDTATQERMIEIQEVINILQEEKAARGL